MAIAWTLRLPVVATVLVRGSSPQQLCENVGALERLDFSEDERGIDELTLA